MPFAHEKLRVYQLALEFVAWASELASTLPSGTAVKGQLDRAATSIVLNIAEGNGKFSRRDRTRFLQIASGSALECAAALDVVVAKGIVTADDVADGKAQLASIVNQLYGLIRWCREDGDGVREEEAVYGVADERGWEWDQD